MAVSSGSTRGAKMSKPDAGMWTPSALEGVVRVFTAMVGLTAGFLGLVSILPENNMELYAMPYLRTSSIAHIVTLAGGRVQGVFADLASDASTLTECDGDCLLDAFTAEASASCAAPEGALVDRFVQLFVRVVTYEDGKLVTSDVDMGLSFGIRLAATVACLTLGVSSLIAALLHPRTVLRDHKIVLMREQIFAQPMYNILRGAESIFAFAFASVYAMVLVGDQVINDIVLDGVFTASLLALALIHDRAVAAFLAVNHSPAYKREKGAQTHAAHHASLPAIVVQAGVLATAASLHAVMRGARAYNYGLSVPGLADTVYLGAVTLEVNYGGRVMAVALSVIEFTYLVLIPLAGLNLVIEVMNGQAERHKTRYADYVDIYRFNSFVKATLLLALVCTIYSVSQIAIATSAAPACTEADLDF
jgi:hypothetical protein